MQILEWHHTNCLGRLDTGGWGGGEYERACNPLDANRKNLEHLSVMRVQIIVRRHLSLSISIPDSPVELCPHALDRVFIYPTPRTAEVIAVPEQKVGEGGSHRDVRGQ